MTLIGITGKKRHGKDTLASMIATEGWVIDRFAGPLKEMARDIFNLSDEEIDGAHKERLFETPILMDNYLPAMRDATGLDLQPAFVEAKNPRHVMQYIGTEYVRAVDPQYWLRCMEVRLSLVEHAVLTDTRFLNEASFVRRLGGIVVRIVRTDLPPADDPHPSEVEIDLIDPDIEIINDGDFERLRAIALLLRQPERLEASRF